MSAAEDFALLADATARLRKAFGKMKADLRAAESECDQLRYEVEGLEDDAYAPQAAWWLADDLHREAHGSGLFVLCRETACLRLKDALLPGWRENRPAAWLNASG